MISKYTTSQPGVPMVSNVYEQLTPELQWATGLHIGFVLEGELELSYEHHTRQFWPHDILFFLPFENYSFTRADTDAALLTFQVDADFLNELVPDLPAQMLQQHHLSHNLQDETYRRICRDMAAIIFNNLKKEPDFRLRMLAAVTDLASTILENYCIRARNVPAPDYATKRVRDILGYINDHYTEKISVGNIASSLGIHPQYFSAFFTKYFHTGFPEYLSTFRVNASMGKLLYSDESILDIALDYGFSSHKTYDAAFRRLHHMTPMEYRKSRLALAPDEVEMYIDQNADSDYGMFSFFRQFSEKDKRSSSGETHTIRTLNFESWILLSRGEKHQPMRICTIGRAFACLRRDVQEQMRRAREDLCIDYFRIRDIFSDSLYVYYETAEKKPVFHWQTLDSVLDAILDTGASPFLEIGFMPEALASKKQYASLQFHPNISAPKSMAKWKSLIREFLRHIIDRYGMNEISKWYFDFWTSPDLGIKNSYWHESMEDFFAFYRATYDVFQKTDPALRLGSPNFSTIDGFPWYQAFFRYCLAQHIHPAYISFHAYGCSVTASGDLPGDINAFDTDLFPVTDRDLVRKHLLRLHEIMNVEGFRGTDIIVSDFNLNFMPADLIRDTCYMGPYLAHTAFQTMGLVKGLGHWCLSDIHEDAYPRESMFWGGPGFLNYNGLKKASYNALALLNRIGDTVLDRGENYLLAKSGDIYQLYIYNLAEFDEFDSGRNDSAPDHTHRYRFYKSGEDLYLNILFTLPKGSYYVKKYEVNRDYGSSYDIWAQIGCPERISRDMEDYLRENSVPHITYSVVNVETTLLLEEKIPVHGLLLIEIKGA